MKWLVILAAELGVIGWVTHQIDQLCQLACAVGAYGY
jgi:hypothetical protein